MTGRRIAVVGGGIVGAAVADRLTSIDSSPQVTGELDGLIAALGL